LVVVALQMEIELNEDGFITGGHQAITSRP
jgi:hypothetical protein